MFTFNYKGEQWGYAFVDPDGCLKHEDRETLIWNAIDLHKSSRTRRNIRGEGFEGQIRDTKKYTHSGTFYGKSIKGFVETNKGKKSLEILIQDGNPAVLN